MKAVRLVKYVTEFKGDLKECLEVQTVATPIPGKGEVLIKVERSPINPSDQSQLRSPYDRANARALPAACGFEGSGTVVQSGGGLFAWLVNGKRVAAAVNAAGMWSEYVVAYALQCVALPTGVSFEQGSSVFVNPLTVVAFVEIAKAGKHKTVVHTAAASVLGKMLVRYGKRNGIEVIGVVRSQQHKRELLELGAKAVIVTTDEGWQRQLATVCAESKCTLAFDAVAGPQTGKLLDAMPPLSELHVYGALSGEPVGAIAPGDLISAHKRVVGFYLPIYFKGQSMLHLKTMVDTVVSRLTDDFQTPVQARFPLEQIGQALRTYSENMSGGKVLIAPTFKP